MITYFRKYGVDSYKQHDKPDLESAEAQRRTRTGQKQTSKMKPLRSPEESHR